MFINSDYPVDRINLFTSEGKQVQITKPIESNNETVLFLNGLKQGFYFLEIQSKSAKHVSRFI